MSSPFLAARGRARRTISWLTALLAIGTAACRDTVAPQRPLAARSGAADLAPLTPTAGTSGIPLPLANATGACLTAGSDAYATATTLAPCTSNAAVQSWVVPTTGTTGPIRLPSGLCLDAWGASGVVGTKVGTYTCFGAPNQQWTLTAAGELRGQNGYCVALPSGETVLTLQVCTGAAAQKWIVVAAAAASDSLVHNGTGACLASTSATGASETTATGCNPAAATQRWTLPTVDTWGAVKVGALCLDAWGAAGTPGTQIGTWTCTAPGSGGSEPFNQLWKLTAAGELRGQNNHCATVSAGTAPKLTLQVCDGSAAQRWSTLAAPPATPRPTQAMQILRAGDGSPCVSSTDSGATANAVLSVRVCNSATAQRFMIPAVGTPGPIQLGNSLCVDLPNSGPWNDSLIVRTCTGLPTQQWTITANGSLMGFSGRCGNPSSSGINARLNYWGCVGGTWKVQAAGPLPKPVPVSPRLTGTAGVFSLMAATPPSVAAQTARGGVWAKYENDFVSQSQTQWAADATSYNANFYDRAMIYYVMWARTGNTTYLDRANALALGARSFVEGQLFRPQPYMAMIDGVALHALMTGDAQSAQAVAKVADFYGEIGGWWWQNITNTAEPAADSRSEARILSTLLDAWYLKVPSPNGYDYPVILRDFLNRILSTQSADGAYRWISQCYYNKPFEAGMLNDALIRYYTTFEPDPRIPAAIKKSVDYMWATDWRPAISQFAYLDNTCSTSGESGGPTADLNNMIVSGFGFVAKTLGDASYYTKGDAIFAGGVNGAWIVGQKMFNQEYTSSYRYLSLRF